MQILYTTDPILNPFALNVIRLCHYQPGRKHGHPVAVVVQQTVVFWGAA